MHRRSSLRAPLGILRVEEGEGGGAEAPKPTPPADSSKVSGDAGFPANTPLEQMTSDQREAYWKHQSRKHEERSRALGNLTAEELADLRDKASKHAALERELMSERDKAVLEATESTKAQILASVTPRLVAAEFKAAAAGHIDSERLARLIEPLDLSKFVKDGEVDTEKVAAFVADIPPSAPVPPKGPTSQGQGQRGSATGPSVASGRELYLSQKKR